jgi:hypothetical protein
MYVFIYIYVCIYLYVVRAEISPSIKKKRIDGCVDTYANLLYFVLKQILVIGTQRVVTLYIISQLTGSLLQPKQWQMELGFGTCNEDDSLRG